MYERRIWTSDEVQAIVAAYRSGVAVKTIALQFHTRGDKIKRILLQQGITWQSAAKRLFTPEQEDDIVRRYQAGAALRSLSAEHHTKPGLLTHVLRTHGVELRGRHALTRAQEQELLTAYAAGDAVDVLSARFNCDPVTIWNVIRRYERPVRPMGGGNKRVFSDEELDVIRTAAADGESIGAIATLLRASRYTISHVMQLHGITVRRGQPIGERHHHWLGGRFIDPYGYVQVRVMPDDPLFSMAKQSGYVMEHRLVMARHLGRPLARHESIHHINGVKTDNRIENLQLRQGKHGNGVVYVCLDCGSHNVKPEGLAERRAHYRA